MTAADITLSRLAAIHSKGEPLPVTVSTDHGQEDTNRFLESFRFDRREAWPALAACVDNIERPSVCEVAFALM